MVLRPHRGHLCCIYPHHTLHVRNVTQQNLASLSLSWWRDKLASPAMGVILCTAAAECFSFLFHESSFKGYLPLLFIVIILLIAIRFGTWAGVVGTLLSSVVFALFLFAPQSSVIVSDLTARSNLIWMVVVGLVLSYFFAATPPSKKEGKN
jgi:K+-sensing histidine kinase KdpD